MGMMRFYPALLFYRGSYDYEVQLLDFDRTGWRGRTPLQAEYAAQRALQEMVDDLDDHQTLPHPTHQMVAQDDMVRARAQYLYWIAVSTKLESDVEFRNSNTDLDGSGAKEKSNDSKCKGDKKKRRTRSRGRSEC
jgi:hypothetical protein